MKLKNAFFLSVTVYLLAIALPLQAAPALKVGKVSAKAGGTVVVPIVFDPAGATITGMQFDLMLPSGLTSGAVTPDPKVTSSEKSVTTKLNGQQWRFIIFGMNQTAISKGPLLTAQFTVSPQTSAKTLPISVSKVAYTDSNGKDIHPGRSTAGLITIKKEQ